MDKDETGERVEAKVQNKLPSSVIKSDVNLSRLPFFALVHRKLTNFKIELTIIETRGNRQLELFWGVTPNIKYGYPGLFAKKVHRAVEYMLIQNGFPVPEYLEFSFYEIVDILEIEPSGKTYSEIKQALLSIMFAAIESKGTFCYLDNGENKWVEDYFNLYDRVVFIGEKFPDGSIAGKNRIYFNKWYLKSLNSLYLKPLDFNYWNSLKKNIAGRLYEFLSLTAFATKCKPFRIEYHRLCGFLPITPQKYFSKAKQILSRAHEELIKTGFLKKVVWRKSKTDPKKWIIIYHFGVRAKSELQRGFKDDTYRPAILAVETADIEEIEELIEPEEKVKEVKSKRKKQTQEEETLSPIAQELFNRGITKSVAIDFAYSFPEEHIKEKIEMHDIKKATGEITTNSAGWLREAIVRDYQLSEEQLKKQAKLSKKQAQQEEQGAIEEKAKEIQEQRIKEALKDFPDSEQWVRERVVEGVKMREMTIKAIGGEQFSEEEITEMYLTFQAEVPETDEYKRAWLIGSSNKYALSSIIEELRQEQQQNQPREVVCRPLAEGDRPLWKQRGRSEHTGREEPTETANEQALSNSIEDVLTEVARQQAEFEADRIKDP